MFVHVRVMRVTIAVLALLLTMQGSASAQSSYYEKTSQFGYCNGNCPHHFGDPIDLATGAFHIDEVLTTLPGRVPVVIGWQFVSQDGSNGPLGMGTSLSTDYFIFPYEVLAGYEAFREFGFQGPKNMHAVFGADLLGDSSNFINEDDPQMLGATLKFNVPPPSSDLSSTLKFRSGDKFFFDAGGALVRMEDRHGNFVAIARNAQGYPTQISEPSGRRVTFAYNGAGKLSSVTLPLGRVWQFDYDPRGRLARVTDPTGAHTDYAWMDSTFGGDTEFPAAPLVRSVTDRRGFTRVTNDYDGGARVIRQTYPDGGALTARYDYAPQLDGSIIAGAPGMNGSTSVTDPGGNVSTKEFTWGGPGGIYGYNVNRSTDRLGRVTSFERKRSDRLLTGLVDFLGRRTDLTWDASGNMLSSTRPTASGGTATSSAIYDARWNVPIAITDELSHTTRFTIDAISGDVTAVTDPGGNTTRFGYASNGDLVSSTTPLGQTTTMRYTSDGDLQGITDALGHTTEFSYDAASRRTSIRDGNSRTVQFSYDTLDRITSVTQMLGSMPLTTTFQYDAEGNLLRLTNPGGHAWQWIYDAMDRVIEAKDPLQQSAFYSWDRNGNLSSWTDHLGQKGEYTYDAVDRRTSATFRKADGSIESTLALNYNSTTRLLDSIADSQFGTYSWTYDSIDQVIGKNSPNGNLALTLDVLGRRTGLQVSGQAPITYGYDVNGNPTSIDQGGLAYSFKYDSLNRLIERQLPNGVSTQWSLDAAGQVSSIFSRRAGATFDSHVFTRDGVGHITGEDRNGEVRGYEYDDLYRLVAVNGGAPIQNGRRRVVHAVDLEAMKQSWTYDSADNRLSATVAGATTAYVYDGDNRMMSVGTAAVSHDANGRLLSDGTRTYTWDVRGRLVSVSSSGSNSRFTYDPFGLRTGKVVDGVSTSYLLDGQDVVSEISGGNRIHTLHGAVVDQPLSRGGLYFTPDHLGSTTTLTDSSGTVVQRYAYSPFGDTSRSTGVNNPFQFAGRENDETGLYNSRARYYSPTWGRFVSQDPIGFEGGSNLYGYVRSDPMNFTDPSGLEGPALVQFNEKKFLDDVAKRVNKKQVDNALQECEELKIKKWKNPAAQKEYADTQKISEEGKKGVKEQGKSITESFLNFFK